MTSAGDPRGRALAAARAGYRVRPMLATDAAWVARVHVEVWREAYRAVLPADYLAGLRVDDFTDQWRQRLARPAGKAVKHVVGLDPHGRIAAIGTAGESRDAEPATEWELWAVNVLACEHGTGLADAMMIELVGERACSLWVLRDNARALRFYARYGFLTDGARKPHAPTGAVETRLVRRGAQ